MRRSNLALLLLMSPLAACLGGPKPPPTLMTLTASATPAPGASAAAGDGQAVLVEVPVVPASLLAVRVPVQTSPTSIAYLQHAQWADAPARLFRQLLAETIAARTGRVVLDPRAIPVSPGFRVGGRLSTFGLDAASGNVVVTYDATLAKAGSDALRTQRFEARAPAASQDAAGVSAALNVAANQVATEVADWIGR